VFLLAFCADDHGILTISATYNPVNVINLLAAGALQFDSRQSDSNNFSG
jgi:hypothetical protein